MSRFLFFCARYWLALALFGAFGCAHQNTRHLETSVSLGATSDGTMWRPVRVPFEGPGHLVPKKWRERGLSYATPELIDGVCRAATQVEEKFDGSGTLGVADFSRAIGGRSRWHRSHQCGRDVDLIFYSQDKKGRALPPPSDAMVPYRRDGRAKKGGRRFDVQRNWALLEALLSDAAIRVQWIFVASRIEKLLLRYAEQEEVPVWLRNYAEKLMSEPSRVSAHDDHFHLRIYCSREDRKYGCEDMGTIWRHEKKAYKYPGPEKYDPYQRRIVRALAGTSFLGG